MCPNPPPGFYAEQRAIAQKDGYIKEYEKQVLKEARQIIDGELRDLHSQGYLEHTIRARELWVAAARDFQREMAEGPFQPE